jgi:hypothetical protein
MALDVESVVSVKRPIGTSQNKVLVGFRCGEISAFAHAAKKPAPQISASSGG